jgi:hypothetical protein
LVISFFVCSDTLSQNSADSGGSLPPDSAAAALANSSAANQQEKQPQPFQLQQLASGQAPLQKEYITLRRSFGKTYSILRGPATLSE